MTGEVILYSTQDGAAQISLRAVDGTVWLTQAEMAALFDTAPQAITQLIKTIYADGEMTQDATCKEFLQVRLEGTRQVERALNRIVTMYLDYAEDQATRRAAMTMAMWTEKLDAFLAFNDRNVLTHAGKLRMDVAQQLAEDRYAMFDAARNRANAVQADAEDMATIEALAKAVSKSGKKP